MRDVAAKCVNLIFWASINATRPTWPQRRINDHAEWLEGGRRGEKKKKKKWKYAARRSFFRQNIPRVAFNRGNWLEIVLVHALPLLQSVWKKFK